MLIPVIIAHFQGGGHSYSLHSTYNTYTSHSTNKSYNLCNITTKYIHKKKLVMIVFCCYVNFFFGSNRSLY